MNNFPQRLKELRTAKGVSQEELGKYLGFRDSTISQYESGKRTPDYDTLIKIAQFFETTTDYLLGHTNSKANDKEKVLGESENTIIAAHRADDIFDRDDLPEDAKQSVLDFIKFVKEKYGKKE